MDYEPSSDLSTETVNEIAKAYLEELETLSNDIENPDLIYPNQVLLLS